MCHEQPNLSVDDPPPCLQDLGPRKDIPVNGWSQEVDFKLIGHGHGLQTDHAQDRKKNGHIGQHHQHSSSNVSSWPQIPLILLHAGNRIPFSYLLTTDSEFLNKWALFLEKLFQAFLRDLPLPHFQFPLLSSLGIRCSKPLTRSLGKRSQHIHNTLDIYIHNHEQKKGP
jgi:hypothetical protein